MERGSIEERLEPSTQSYRPRKDIKSKDPIDTNTLASVPLFVPLKHFHSIPFHIIPSGSCLGDPFFTVTTFITLCQSQLSG